MARELRCRAVAVIPGEGEPVVSSHIFNLVGIDTREIIPVSYGTRYREAWALDQHPGPVVILKLIGGNGLGRRYLYRITVPLHFIDLDDGVT